MQHPEALSAAQWWTRHIREITDARRDQALQRGSRMSLTHQAYLRTYPDNESLVRFCEFLEHSLGARIDQDIENRRLRWGETFPWFISVGVDYHPDERLEDALQQSGISDFVLPEKTFMGIRPESVKVSQGHMAEWIEVFKQDTGA